MQFQTFTEFGNVCPMDKGGLLQVKIVKRIYTPVLHKIS